MSLRRALFAALARLSLRHPRAVMLGALLLAALCAWLGTGLELHSEILDLLPADSPVVREYMQVLERQGTLDRLIVVIEGRGEDDAEVREEMADALAARLLESGLAVDVDYRLDEERIELFRELFGRFGLYYLDPSQRDAFLYKLSDDGIRAQVAANRALLGTSASVFAEEAISSDPLNLRELYYPWVDRFRGQLRFEYLDGYFFTPDLGYLLVIVRPSGNPADLPFVERLFQELESAEGELLAEARDRLAEEDGEAPAQATQEAGEAAGGPGAADAGVHFLHTGSFALAREYNRLLKHDIGSNLAVAAVAILICFYWLLGGVSDLVGVALTLAVGLAWVFGAARLLVGHFNLFTAGSAAILLGLGIDFSLHLLQRYRQERRRGEEHAAALERSVVEVGHGAWAACLTTSIGFYAALVTDFKGLRELGWIGGTGMLLLMASTFIVLPAFLSLRAGRADAGRADRFGGTLRSLAVLIETRPWRVLLGLALLTLGLGAALPRLTLEEGFEAFQPKNSVAAQARREITRRVGAPLETTLVTTVARGEDELWSRSEALTQALKPLLADGTLASYSGLDSVLPSRSRQEDNRRWMEAVRREQPARVDLARIESTLRQALAASGFSPNLSPQPALDLVRALVETPAPLTLETLEKAGAGQLLERFVVHEPAEGGEPAWRLTAYLYPTGNLAELARGFKRIQESLRGIEGAWSAVSIKALNQEIKRLLGEEATLAAAAALLGIVVMLYLNLRRVRTILLTLLPLGISVVWVLGALGWLGIRFSLIDAVLVPVLLGVGIDSGIYLTHRLRERHSLEEAMQDTGRAMLTATLTTMIGFGSLAFSSFPAVQAAGYFMVFGVGSMLVAYLTLLPAIDILRRRKQGSGDL